MAQNRAERGSGPVWRHRLFMHFEGATRWACVSWDSTPNRLDDHPERIWDWHDPPFLRGLRGGAPR